MPIAGFACHSRRCWTADTCSPSTDPLPRQRFRRLEEPAHPPLRPASGRSASVIRGRWNRFGGRTQSGNPRTDVIGIGRSRLQRQVAFEGGRRLGTAAIGFEAERQPQPGGRPSGLHGGRPFERRRRLRVAGRAGATPGRDCGARACRRRPSEPGTGPAPRPPSAVRFGHTQRPGRNGRRRQRARPRPPSRGTAPRRRACSWRRGSGRRSRATPRRRAAPPAPHGSVRAPRRGRQARTSEPGRAAGSTWRGRQMSAKVPMPARTTCAASGIDASATGDSGA